MRKPRNRLAALCGTAAVSIGALAAPAAEAQPTVVGTAGLVNVVLVDVVDVNNNNVAVQVPVGVAANVCDVNAAVLIAAIEDEGEATCESTSTAVAAAFQGQRPD